LGLNKEELLEQRYSKFRVLGKFIESNNFEEIQEELPQITE
jgi:acetyl-CoA carboxylase carboxyl transferase subunit alpha